MDKDFESLPDYFKKKKEVKMRTLIIMLVCAVGFILFCVSQLPTNEVELPECQTGYLASGDGCLLPDGDMLPDDCIKLDDGRVACKIGTVNITAGNITEQNLEL